MYKVLPSTAIPKILKDKLPISEKVWIVALDLGQSYVVDKVLIQTNLCDSILKFEVSDGLGDAKNVGVLYKTINKQIVVVQMLIRNDPFIVVVNCGYHRGRKCLETPSVSTFPMGGNYVRNQCCDMCVTHPVPNIWVSDSWIPICSETVFDVKIRRRKTQMRVDEARNKVVLYDDSIDCISCLGCLLNPLCWPCVPCFVCASRTGNTYDMVDKSAWISKSFVHVTLKSVGDADVTDCDFSLNGEFPNIAVAEVTIANPLRNGAPRV
jgi:hypothetical protein